MRFVIVIALTLSFVAPPAFAGTKKYTYDAAGRLIRVDYGNGKGFNYRYDANGNLLSRQPLSAEQPGRRRPARLSSTAGQPSDSTAATSAGPAAPQQSPTQSSSDQ